MRGLCLLGVAVAMGCFNPGEGDDDSTGASSTGMMDGGTNGTNNPGDDGTPSADDGVGPDDDGSTSGDSTTPGDSSSGEPPADSSSGDGPSVCATCILEPPPGWTGPSARTDMPMRGDCVSPFANNQLDIFDALDVPASACGCDCGDAEVECGPLELFYFIGCGQPLGPEVFVDPTPDSCIDNTPIHNSVIGRFLEDQGSAVCPAQLTEDLPTPLWGSEQRLCDGVFDRGTCLAGELCVGDAPVGFAPELCIHRSGDENCPPTYPNKTLHSTGLEDTRACSECTCTPGNNFECETTFHTYNNNICDGDENLVDSDTCIASWSSFEFDEPNVVGACIPGSSTESGEVTATGVETVCCG